MYIYILCEIMYDQQYELVVSKKSWDGMGTTFRQTSLRLGSMGSNCGTSLCIPFISMPSQIGNIGVYP